MVEGGQEGVKAVLQRGILLKIIQVSSALAISFGEKIRVKSLLYFEERHIKKSVVTVAPIKI